MIDIVIRGLSPEEFKRLKLLKIQRDSSTWKKLFLGLYREWKNPKIKKKQEKKEPV